MKRVIRFLKSFWLRILRRPVTFLHILSMAGPPRKFANFVEKTDFYGKTCPRIRASNV
jgi:hypothetical protein